jgi:DNA-binding XRE family transcriptional regulator
MRLMESGEQADKYAESFERTLFRAAEQQIEADHHFLAVVMAQVAVEAVVEVNFVSLFGVNLPRSMQTMMDVLPDRSFMHKGTRALWTDLTGDDITKDKSIWTPYHKHIERRNKAAHGGAFGFRHDPITREEAEASIAAARNLTTHIWDVMQEHWSLLTEPDGFRADEFDSWRGLRVLTPYGEERTATEVGRAVREAREEAGMSREALARAAEMHSLSLLRLENGARPPRVSTLVRVAHALRITVADLVGRADLDAWNRP